MLGMRAILDPTQAQTSSIPKVQIELPVELPFRVRHFGYHPPLPSFESGDLLLFSPKAPSAASLLVIQDQKRYFDESHARWTHAAVYMHDGKIIEATPRNGITFEFVHKYIPTHDILVRRHLTITPFQRTSILLHAMSAINKSYPIVELTAHMVREWLYQLRPFDANTYNICSELFHRSCMEATKSGLQGCPANGLTKPAHLSLTNSLSDIEIPWMQLK
jgi:hypothetical protein